MAYWKTQAWVTSVVNEESVPGAIALAESLRRSKTTRRTVVITSKNVSMEKRFILRENYDLVFSIDDVYIGEIGRGTIGEVQVRAYVFALILFEKCIFISPNSLVLENADALFDSCVDFESRVDHVDGSIDTSIFMVRPECNVWEHIWNSVKGSLNLLSEKHLEAWIKNQGAVLKMGLLPDKMICDFSLSTGKLKSARTHAPIIRFVEGNGNEQSTMLSYAKLLKKMELGLAEMRMTDSWMNMYETVMLKLSKQPFVAVDPFERFRQARKHRQEPIAVVGMSCRYPGANSVQEFWNMLYVGEEGITEPPAFRWSKEHTLRVTQQDRKSQAGFLATTVDEFDARFFGVSPKEAAYMDPQTRLLHEVLWESLEDAGINPLSLYGTHAGIFTGSWMNDYKDIVAGSVDKDFFRTYMGNSTGAAAARLSFLLGLTGPSIATESGCSSAIVAVDLAVKSLRNGETNLALAGGVNLLLHPFNSSMMEYVFSPDGRCKTFDAKANGFGRAEGCGVLVLKRLGDALRDRDNIWATIRGSAVSQEGISRSLGTPTVHCESLAMKLALKDANVEPERVSFVETHGTGTAVGDPMEVAAIAKAYHSTNRKEPLVIGSVKTNVGHTESCSGITGIMKAVLAMHHEIIPKHRNLETLNPEIFLDSIPAIIPTETLPWPKVAGVPRICGVSSFGITGTDGHVILQEAPVNDLPKFSLGMERPTQLMTISAKTREALDELLQEYENRFAGKEAENAPPKVLADTAYTANVGRAAFCHRTFLVASNFASAAKMLKEKKLVHGEVKEGHNPQVCMLFTGQGSQYQGMARSLYETSPVFRIHFDHCDRELRTNYGISSKKVVWDTDFKELSRTIFSQTSIFCVEYCLLKLWQSWGVHPDFVLGHSLGEFCAAVAAGVMDFQDALKLVAERSLLIDNLPRGSMLVVKASKQAVEKLLKEAKIDLDFAAVNNPEQTVVAGDTRTVEQFLTFLKAQNVKAIILEATHAFHSRHMDPMLEQYKKVAQTINFKRGNSNVQYVSGMEGRVIENPSEMSADYWVRHTREKVSFTDACAVLKESGCQDFLEVGPQPVLSSFVMMNNEGVSLNCLPSLRRGQDDWETVLTSLGKLYLLGYSIDWKGYDEPYIRQKVSLPFHPFHRKPFWVECTPDTSSTIHPLVGHPVKNASALNIFQNDLTVKAVPYLKDHCIGSRIVFPGAGYTEMCLSAGYCVANGLTDTFDQPTRPMRLENVRIDAPLELKEGKSCRLQVIVDLPEQKTEKQEDEASSGFRVKVFHQNSNSGDESGKWVLHASSAFLPVASTKECLSRWDPSRISEITAKDQASTAEISPDSFYKRVDEQGLKFGESFRSIRRIWTKEQSDCKEITDEVVTEVALPSDWNKYLLHPLIIDACFQTGILTRYNYEPGKLKVPVRIRQLTLFSGVSATPPELDTLYIHVRTTEHGIRHLFICTPTLIPVAFVDDVEFIDTNVRTIESVLEQQSSAVPDAWEESWKVIPSPFSSSVEIPAQMELLRGVAFVPENPKEYESQYRDTQRLLYLYIVGALQELGWCPEVGSQISPTSISEQLQIQPAFEPLLRFYLTQIEKEGEALRRVDTSGAWQVVRQLPSPNKVQEEAETIVTTLKGTSVRKTAVIYEHLAHSLPKVLRGQVSALQLLFPLEEERQQYSAEHYYQTHPSRGEQVHVVSSLAEAMLQQVLERNGSDPKKMLRLLEVGAGTGSMSMKFLELVRRSWGSRFEYYYTDISHSFFIKAEKKLEEYKDNLKFAVFNLEESPLCQGIPLEYFDSVCCTDVLHATRNLEETLVHLRQTLKPGGVLFFTETIIPARDITYVFGLLEGYWRFEDKERRPDHCCVSEQDWKTVLESTGFGEVRVDKMYMDQFGFIWAVAEEGWYAADHRLPRRTTEQAAWTIFTEPSHLDLSNRVADMLQASGCHVTLALREGDANSTRASEGVTVKQCGTEAEIQELMTATASLQGVIYKWGIASEEVDQGKLALPLLHVIKALVTMLHPPQLFVVTRGVHAVQEDTLLENPSTATLFGMVKSFKNEFGNIMARCVDLDAESSPEEMAVQLLYEMAMTKSPKEAQRLQVAYRDGVRYEPRLGKAQLLSGAEALKLPPSTDRYKLKLPAHRVIQDLVFEPDERRALQEQEVEVQIQAYALNFRDILTILKPIADFEKFNAVGLDFAGVVVRVGRKENARLKVGDRVFGANFKDAQLPSHLNIEADSLLRVPDNMTFNEAATLPAVFLTAFHCLLTLADLRKGDIVLIHTASGGVGLAAIQLAKHVGAKIIATAGSSRKKTYLRRNLGLEHVFHSRDTSFEEDILRVTRGRGVDVVLNSITGPGIKEATLRATAKNGRFIEMSKLHVWTPEEVKALRPDVAYHLIDLTTLDKPAFTDLFGRIQAHLSGGVIKPIPHVRFDVLHIRQALQYFQKAKHIGKIVVAMPQVLTHAGQFVTKSLLFNGDSTYLITGGLGGIGFEVCKWMLDLGATDIALMGRSSPKPDVVEQIQKLNENGANVMVRLGDVGNFARCQEIIGEVTASMKPLRGVMHCAGVLRDNLYANQTWSDFEATYTPKVQGTWNLHNLTKSCPLEHFVVYSSLTALVGTPAQPNHASANCFEDAFIHYRHSLGLPGTTINWGHWAQVGCAKDASLSGVLPVSVQRMLNGLEIALKSQKLQVCFSEFDSFTNLSMLCPSLRNYLEERLWKQYSTSNADSAQTLLNADKFWEQMNGAETAEGKATVMSGYLKNILRGALRLDADEPIGEHANIQELGVDSLMLIELRNSIQSLLGSRLTITAVLLKNCNTVRLLANEVVGKLMEEDSGQDISAEPGVALEPLPAAELRELLYQDATLPEIITPAPDALAPVKPSDIKTVLVTGATGQVGPYLIAELNRAYPSVENIYCLVRDADKKVAQDRIRNTLMGWKNTEVILGNVAQEKLGMTLEKYEKLAHGVDAVIHCAAKTNYMEHFRAQSNKNQSDIRSVNIGGTLNILKFASTGKVKHIYYPSSLICGIFGENSNGSLADSWTDISVIDAIVSTKAPGLQTSRWVCEILLSQANQRGIPCKVFRLPWIGGESKTGGVDPLRNMYIMRYLSFLKLGAIPDAVIPTNVLPVDHLAEHTLRLFVHDETPNEIFNIAHPQPHVEQEFVRVAKEAFGKELEILETRELEQRIAARNHGQDNDEFGDLLKTQNMLTSSIGDVADFVTGYVSAPDTFFRNEKVSRYVDNFGADFPSTMEVVRRDLQFLKNSGQLDKFGI